MIIVLLISNLRGADNHTHSGRKITLLGNISHIFTKYRQKATWPDGLCDNRDLSFTSCSWAHTHLDCGWFALGSALTDVAKMIFYADSLVAAADIFAAVFCPLFLTQVSPTVKPLLSPFASSSSLLCLYLPTHVSSSIYSSLYASSHVCVYSLFAHLTCWQAA